MFTVVHIQIIGVKMKKALALSLLAACISSSAYASAQGDALYAQSFVSVNKGDCVIENAESFAPAIQSFKMLIGSQAMQDRSGAAFISYNMLGTSVGVMTPAQYSADKFTGAQTISGQILLGLADVADVQIKTALNNAAGTQESTGTISISAGTRTVFASTFTCK